MSAQAKLRVRSRRSRGDCVPTRREWPQATMLKFAGTWVRAHASLDAGLRGRIATAFGKAANAVIGTNGLTALDARYAGVAALDLGGNPLTDPRLLAALKKSDTRNLDATGTDPWAEVSPIGPRCLSLGDNGVDDRSALEGLGKLRASSSPIGLETSE